MNNEAQRKLYEMEVMPPVAVWENLSRSIDEINADNTISMKLSAQEILPPGSFWEKLSISIDEINSDNFISKKISRAEALPPATVWEKIKYSIGIAEETYQSKKGSVINFRRLAAAAVFLGIIITVWLLLRNTSAPTQIVAQGSDPVENSAMRDTNTFVKQEPSIGIEELSTTSGSIALAGRQPTVSKSAKDHKSNRAVATASNQTDALIHDTPGENSFNRPIDDLSLVTASDKYMTMVNSNGRLVKIPAEFAQLAPHLQNKPVRQDIYEIMFGEGTYWKETLDEWRKKVISLPVTSGDAFNSFIELLKTVQDN